jgi:signal transduction histidine kinase
MDPMDAGVVILVQVVNWPLAALVAWRAATRRIPPVAGAGVAVLLVAAAVAAWDPASEAGFSRVAVVVVNATLAVLLAVYPDGRPVPRWILIPAAIEVALQAGNLLSGLRWETQPWWPAHFIVTWGLLLFGGQLYRYIRRSSVDERERSRWPLLGLMVMIVAFTLWTIAAAAGVAPVDSTWFAGLLLAIPAPMFAVGLVAPRAVRVDRMLRLVVRWGLWAVVVAVVAWSAALVTSGLDPIGAAWITAGAAAVVAVPAALGLRRVADLVVYGRKADPLRTLDQLGGRLEASVDPRDVPSEIVATVTGALGVSGATLRGAPPLEATAGDPPVGGEGDEGIPIRYQGELLATLVVRPRPGDRQLAAQDRALIEQVCRQAAPALHGARVLGELIEARSRIVRASEEERKRLRRDLHDDLAPTFAGLGLSAAAVEALTRAGDDRAGDAAAALVGGLHSATRQLRDVAYDLRPPVLDDRGLVAAIEDRVVSTDAIPMVRLDAPRGPWDLPAAVELAALRIVQEAVMNVRRHAAASECIVSLREGADGLEVTIVDDGRGLPAHRHDGVGLRSMRERAEEVGGILRVRRRRERGTIVEAVLPVRAAPAAVAIDRTSGMPS